MFIKFLPSKRSASIRFSFIYNKICILKTRRVNTYSASLICVWDKDMNWCASGHPCIKPNRIVMALRKANTFLFPNILSSIVVGTTPSCVPDRILHVSVSFLGVVILLWPGRLYKSTFGVNEHFWNNLTMSIDGNSIIWHNRDNLAAYIEGMLLPRYDYMSFMICCSTCHQHVTWECQIPKSTSWQPY